MSTQASIRMSGKLMAVVLGVALAMMVAFVPAAMADEATDQAQLAQQVSSGKLKVGKMYSAPVYCGGVKWNAKVGIKNFKIATKGDRKVVSFNCVVKYSKMSAKKLKKFYAGKSVTGGFAGGAIVVKKTDKLVKGYKSKTSDIKWSGAKKIKGYGTLKLTGTQKVVLSYPKTVKNANLALYIANKSNKLSKKYYKAL